MSAGSSDADEDPLRTRIRTELAADGIDIDDLLDVGKVISLTRELDELDRIVETLSTSDPQRSVLQVKADSLRTDLSRVKREVMRPFLKRVFIIQGIISLFIGGLLAADIWPTGHVPLLAQALGFWTVWLFSIPSLRARKGMAKWEKNALNVAFVSTPLMNITLPFVTKNCALIWTADTVLLALCYGYYLTRAVDEEVDEKEIGKIRGVIKYLDWGSWK